MTGRHCKFGLRMEGAEINRSLLALKVHARNAPQLCESMNILAADSSECPVSSVGRASGF